jgi:RNA polymerase sigma-70 factor, ECF subfamily
VDQERQWVEAALRGDQQAFGLLVSAYQNPIYNLCFRMLGNAAEAEDAAQETFVRVYRRLGTYDSSRKLSSWMLTIASHYCIDRLRRKRINWVSVEALLPWQPLVSDAVPPEESMIEGESRAQIRRLLQSLPAEDRQVIALRYWQDLSYAEIAQITGATESAVKSRLHRARASLAQQVLLQGSAFRGAPECQSPVRRRRVENAVL